MTSLQADIERRLAQSEPDVEVLLAEVMGGRCLRVFIDHPDGVTLALCERVTALLSEERERYSLEVSSPGLDRPLKTEADYRRFLGRLARISAYEPVESRRHWTGRLTSFEDGVVGVTLEKEGGILCRIPFAKIAHGRLEVEFPKANSAS